MTKHNAEMESNKEQSRVYLPQPKNALPQDTAE